MSFPKDLINAVKILLWSIYIEERSLSILLLMYFMVFVLFPKTFSA